MFITLPETNIFAPENGWLEDDPFLLGPGATRQVLWLLVSGSGKNPGPSPQGSLPPKTACEVDSWMNAYPFAMNVLPPLKKNTWLVRKKTHLVTHKSSSFRIGNPWISITYPLAHHDMVTAPWKNLIQTASFPSFWKLLELIFESFFSRKGEFDDMPLGAATLKNWRRKWKTCLLHHVGQGLSGALDRFFLFQVPCVIFKSGHLDVSSLGAFNATGCLPSPSLTRQTSTFEGGKYTMFF